MSLTQTLRAKQTERKAASDGAGVILTKATNEKRAMTTEEKAEFEKRHALVDSLKSEISDIERQIANEQELSEVRSDGRKGGREDVTGEDGEPDAKAIEVRNRKDKKRFRTWLAEGMEGLSAQDQQEVRDRTKQNRALSGVVGIAGAYTVPVSLMSQIDVAIKWFGGMTQVCTMLPTATGEQMGWPTTNDTNNTGRRVGENTAATTTGKDPVFGLVNLNSYIYTSDIVLLPLSFIQDQTSDVEPRLGEMLGTRLGRILNTETTNGNGNSMPNGILNAATLGTTAASSSAISYADLINLEHSVDPGYRNMPGTGYMFHDNTLKALKLLVDSNGRPLFVAGGVSEGIQNKSPDTINGYGFTINQDMPSAFSSGNKVAVFGNLKKYMIRKVGDLSMVRLVERFAELMQIGFMAYQRYDGNLLDAGTHPIKFLQN